MPTITVRHVPAKVVQSLKTLARRLLTFDKAVIKAFPGIAIRPRDLPEC